MNEFARKARLYLMVGYGLVFLEILAGVVAVTVGIAYREYDRAAGYEMLEVIREVDRNYYALLTESGDPGYLEEFRRIHTTRGNSAFIFFGFVLIGMGASSMLPLAGIQHALGSIAHEQEQASDTPDVQLKREPSGQKPPAAPEIPVKR
jgi:hypothetical protein